MPMISLKLAHPKAEALVKEAAQLAWSLSARWLGKDPKLMAVAVEPISPDHWFVAGRPLSEHDSAGFFLEVHVTEGTCTKDEKAAFMAEAFAALRNLLGEVHPESYVYVIDASADAYGYGGLTQERRYVEGHPLGSAAKRR